MLWFALGVIAVAGITLVFLRLWALSEPRDRFSPPPSAPVPRPARPLAPDDDEEFLRSLSQRED
jgi:hypothetical protein